MTIFKKNGLNRKEDMKKIVFASDISEVLSIDEPQMSGAYLGRNEELLTVDDNFEAKRKKETRISLKSLDVFTWLAKPFGHFCDNIVD